MSGFEVRLRRTLHRVWLLLGLGVLGLLLGLGPRPTRGDALFGLLLLLVVVLLAAPTARRLPRPVPAFLHAVPRYRPLLAVTAVLLGCVTLLVLAWTIVNALAPGTFAPLSLALVGVAAAGAAAVLERFARR